MDGSGVGYGAERSSDDAPRRIRGEALLGPTVTSGPLAEVERETIAFAVRLYDGNLSEAARRLGIGRSTLYRRLTEIREA